MLSSIVPLGERARNRRWGVTVTAYVIGSLAAGLGLGGIIGLVGGAVVGSRTASSPIVLAIVAAAFVLGAAVDGGVGRLSLPTIHRQVDEDWLQRYRGWVYGVGFGFQLGLGVVTIVTTATVYLLFALAFVSGSWPAGAALGGAFGLVRAVPILAMAKVTTPNRLRDAHRRMQGWGPAAARVAIGVQCTVAVIAIAEAVRV
jgi:hypothetical protein